LDGQNCLAIGAARQEKTHQLFFENSVLKSNGLLNKPVAIETGARKKN
jgi:hypothetical protein